MGMLKWTKAAQLSFSPLLPATGQEERKGRKAISYMYSLGNYTYTHMASFFSSKKFRIFFSFKKVWISWKEVVVRREDCWKYPRERRNVRSVQGEGGMLEVSKGEGGM